MNEEGLLNTEFSEHVSYGGCLDKKDKSTRKSSSSIGFRLNDSFRSLHSITNDEMNTERIHLISIDDNDKKKIQLAATFLSDFEAGRSPLFSGRIPKYGERSLVGQFTTYDSISNLRLIIYWVRFHPLWEIIRFFAVSMLFVASCYEEPWHSNNLHNEEAHFLLLTMSMLFLSMEVITMLYIKHIIRSFWSLLVTSCSLLLCSSCLICLLNIPAAFCVGIVKPVVLYLMYPQYKDGVDALLGIIPIASKVIMMELILIGMSAAMATCLFSDFQQFAHFETSFLSMFKLSTTVVNPSIWMDIYNDNRDNAFFFVMFGVACIFYLHSLVLSTVFRHYVSTMTQVIGRRAANKERCLLHAFRCLQQNIDCKSSMHAKTGFILDAMRCLRAHYSETKIIDPSGVGIVDFDSFREKVPLVLNMSLRHSPSDGSLAILYKCYSTFVAVANMSFVVLLASEMKTFWLDKYRYGVSSVLLVLCMIETLFRSSFCYGVLGFRIARMNRAFDGIAVIAAVISCYGIYLKLSTNVFGVTEELNFWNPSFRWVFIGRTLDIARFLRLFGVYKYIIKRTGDIAPALMGTIMLVYSAIHIYTYIGMMLFGNMVTPGDTPDIEAFYDLNNFNSYSKGLVTMYQILVVNDWHAIAAVFVHNSSALTVYVYFISANLIVVSILLNVMISFFVSAFAFDDNRSRSNLINFVPIQIEIDHQVNLEFIERIDRFDHVMKTIVGENIYGESDATNLSEALGLLEMLYKPMNVGFMVCSQSSLVRHGNYKFTSLIDEYIGPNMLHILLTDLQNELQDKHIPGGRKKYHKGEKCMVINYSQISNKNVCLFVAFEADYSKVELDTPRCVSRQKLET